MTCEHVNFLADCAVGRIQMEAGGPIEGYVLDVSVKCADCGISFVFNWTDVAHPNVIPLSIELQKKRPWVSGLGTILGCTMSPADEQWAFGNTTDFGTA